MAEWVDAAASEQLAAGGRWLLRRSGCEVALFNVQGSLYAIDDSCPHAGGSLVIGQLDGTTVTCRAHGLRFDLASGCTRGGAGLKVRTYPVRVQEGRIQVDIEAPA
jgi:3-phenylpropionate/trans-cinnamate dioxygenase ferredoxin subunit